MPACQKEAMAICAQHMGSPSLILAEVDRHQSIIRDVKSEVEANLQRAWQQAARSWALQFCV